MDRVLLVHRGAAVAGRALHGDPDFLGEGLADVGGVAHLFFGHLSRKLQEGAPQPFTRNQASASVWDSSSASETSTTSAIEQRRRPSRARNEDSQWQRGSHFGAVAKSQTA